ncbi:MAG: AAA family ATPase [Myxococcota bacterium]
MARRAPTPEEEREIDAELARAALARQALPARKEPYFGVLCLEREGKHSTILLGPEAHLSPTLKIVDWRTAPLAEAYFGFSEGQGFELEAEGRALVGLVEQRRMVRFEEGELAEIQTEQARFLRESGAWTVDPGPRPPLLNARSEEVRARAEIGGLVALDAHQRSIVERPPGEHLLVLGEAGFGKTTVALHRLAYLARAHAARGAPFRALVIVPTGGLERLSSLTLDRLGVERGVEVRTYERWIRHTARKAFADLPPRDSEDASAAVLRLKRHPAVKQAILALVKAEAPRRTRARRSDLLALFGDTAFLSQIVAEAGGAIPSHAVQETLEHTKVQFSPTTEHAHRHVDRDALITSDGRAIDEGTPDSDAESMDTEDGAVMFAIDRARTKGKHEREAPLPRYDLVVVDEAQEMAPLELEVIGRSVGPQGSLTVAGDAEQQVDDTVSFRDFDATMQALGPKAWTTERLTESYRCPEPVTRLAQAIVGRSGGSVIEDGAYIRRSLAPTPLHHSRLLIDELRLLEAADPRACIAVICRSPSSARRLEQSLRRGLATRLCLGGDFDFRPGTIVTAVEEVKGLEFDVVVVPDASQNVYLPSPESRRALYVAVTRTKHQLWLVAEGAWSEAIPGPG